MPLPLDGSETIQDIPISHPFYKICEISFYFLIPGISPEGYTHKLHEFAAFCFELKVRQLSHIFSGDLPTVLPTQWFDTSLDWGNHQ